MLNNFSKRYLIVSISLATAAISLMKQSAMANPPGNVRVVDNSVSTGGNGQTWAGAYKYLQDALNDPALGSTVTEIWVAKSSTVPPTPYRPDQGTGFTLNNRAHTFGLVAGVKIFGGAIPGQDDLNNREKDGKDTILSGDIGTAGTATDNSFHVVTAVGGGSPTMTTTNTWLDGFTVRDGYARLVATPQTSDGGAGILCTDNGNARFVNLTITNNRAGHAFGIEDEETDVNRTSGAGVKSKNASPVFINCTMTTNAAVNGWFIYGGGFSAVNGGSPKLISCTLRDNGAQFGGGVAVRSGSSLEMINCLLLNNHVNLTTNYTGPAFGGGVSVDGTAGAVTITNCSFVLNSTIPAFLGGAYAQFDNPSGGTCKLHNCIFWKNYRRSPPAIILNQVYIKTNSGALEIRRCDVEGGLTGINNPETPPGGSNPTSPTVYDNNQDVDPQFFSTAVVGQAPSLTSNWHLKCTSPCRDVATGGGNGNSLVPCDQYDIDNDTLTCTSTPTEATPDRDRRLRIANSVVDQGCFERILCDGDANGDGVINIDDLLVVITNWGQTSGPGDVYPQPCAGNNIVNIDDLILGVINHWGPCPDLPDEVTVDDIPTSFQECWDKCSQNYETGSEDWQTCMDACVQALCEMGYITEGCE